MTLDDFRVLEPGTALRLCYDKYNKGEFTWIHSHVEGDTVFGQFQYDDMDEPSEVGDFLYVHRGEVCRGSGAEPVHVCGRKVSNG